ncbi:hypothetical protein DdX_14548 [Ditylenchus destructor]|uniref:Uncharacterized protein n=1 Tax=Ditylenchus destructor TaxID=166010 RepID=A0AAD4MU40_9BILA|nr:hypothetical protein DdX_14548 [Ditylenchus destructor]
MSAFISATVPNAFKIVFLQYKEQDKDQVEEPLATFRETKRDELKKGLPVEYQEKWLEEFYQGFSMDNDHFEIDTLVRCSI